MKPTCGQQSRKWQERHCTTNEPTLKSTFLWTAGLGANDFIGRQSHFETVFFLHQSILNNTQDNGCCNRGCKQGVPAGGTSRGTAEGISLPGRTTTGQRCPQPLGRSSRALTPRAPLACPSSLDFIPKIHFHGLYAREQQDQTHIS